MELARDINRSNACKSLSRRKDPDASSGKIKKYQVIAIEHAALARNREFVSCSVFENSSCPSLPAVLLELPVSVV